MPGTDFLERRASGKRCEPPSHPRVEMPTVRSIVAARPSRLVRLAARAQILDALPVLASEGPDAVIVEGEAGTAIFEGTDLIRACLQLGQTGLQAPVGDWAHPCISFASTTSTLHECREMMRDSGQRHLPIRDGGKLVDLLSLEELLEWLAAHYEDIIRAKNIDQQLMFLRGTYSC